MAEYQITLYNHDEIREQATATGNTPKHALLTATLETYPQAANIWPYKDDADGSGSLVNPEDEHIFYLADPVLEDEDEELTLVEMKAAILADRHNWSVQRGPNDTSGYERDADAARDVEKSRTWDELGNCCPMSWKAAFANRCHRKDV